MLMADLLLRTLLLGSCLWLGVPAGTCCGDISARDEVPEEGSHCCRRSEPQENSKPVQLPLKSRIDCCCATPVDLPRPAAVPVSVAEAFIVASPAILVTEWSASSAGPITIDGSPPPRGKLQPLLCIWRC